MTTVFRPVFARRLLAVAAAAIFGSLRSCVSVRRASSVIVQMLVPIVPALLACARGCLPRRTLQAQIGKRSLSVRKSGGRACLVDGADARAGARHRLPGTVKERRQRPVARRARDQQVGLGRVGRGRPAAPLELRLDRETGGRGARPRYDERMRSGRREAQKRRAYVQRNAPSRQA